MSILPLVYNCPKTRAIMPDYQLPPSFGAPLTRSRDANFESEDCLFLDLYGPVSAFSTSATTNIPVIVWFYGGAFLFGTKDSTILEDIPFYDGRGIMETSFNMSQSAIFVTGNYRVGPLGWLAGPTMEQYATPNAGLTDQRLLLQWIKKYIAMFGGDPENVSAWGESAGAGSIMHHITAQEDGRPRDPLFKKAILQSPAFQWQWDNSAGGVLDQYFVNFTNLAGSETPCKGDTGQDAITCLQGLSEDDIWEANHAIYEITKCSGVNNIGPAVDGKVITQLPVVALEASNANGMYLCCRQYYHTNAELLL